MRCNLMYVSRDGVTQSGLFVSVSCVWERLKDEHEVDVFQTVKQLRFHRPQLIGSLVSIHSPHLLLLTSSSSSY